MRTVINRFLKPDRINDYFSCFGRGKTFSSILLRLPGFLLCLRRIDVFPFNNGLWHHLCVAWASVTGDWSVILDGSIMGAGTNWGTGVVVGPGRLIVGQTHLGEVTSVNLWDRKMTNTKIKEMARSYSQELGNVTDWRMFRHGVRGDVEIRYPGSPVSIGEQFLNTTQHRRKMK